jgi:uncharacterized protein YciI
MLFAMIRRGGPAWDGGRSLREQDGFDEHAAFMEALVAEGFVVFGGPLGDGHLAGADSEHRVLLIFDADSEAAIQARLAEDNWTQTGTLSTVSLERWTVLLGELSGR